jgi:hypothetical protein
MDPGLDTGLSLFKIMPNTYAVIDHAVVRYDTESRTTPLSVIMEWQQAHTGMPHRFLYENFHVRPMRVVPDTTALNVIGGLEHWLMSDGQDAYDQVIAQEPVEGKHLATDEALRNAGLYVNENSDSRHVRDANRHACTYLHEIRYLPLIRAAWPPQSVTLRA